MQTFYLSWLFGRNEVTIAVLLVFQKVGGKQFEILVERGLCGRIKFIDVARLKHELGSKLNAG